MIVVRYAVIVCLMVVIAACSSQDPVAQGSGSNTNEIVRPTLDPANEGLVARVNGEGIPLVVYDRELGRRLMGSSAADEAALARQVIDTLIEQQLINQGAASLGVVVTDEEVLAEIDGLKSLTNTWDQELMNQGYTEEEMVGAVRDALITQRVRDQLLAPYLGSILQVNARHIVVRTLQESEEVLSKLNNGEGFATLAAAYSIDTTTRETGGNLGWFARNELFYANLEDVAFNLEIGQIAGPIATGLGYHIIQTMDKAERPVEPERMPMLSESIFSNWLEEQYRNAMVERYM